MRRWLAVLAALGLAAGAIRAETPRAAPGEELIIFVAGGNIRAPETAPVRKDGEGAGPFRRLVVRGATLIDGTGARRLDDVTRKVVRVGGVRYTIHDGIVYDAPALLANVRRIVADAKARESAAQR